MRTNIEIDDELIRAAMPVSGLKTKRAAVEEGLRLLVRLKGQAEVRSLFGRVRWGEDLDDGRNSCDVIRISVFQRAESDSR